MKHYFVGQFRWGVAHLIADDESVLTVDAAAIPPGIGEGGDVRLENGRFIPCPDSEARRARIFRSICDALDDRIDDPI